MSTSKKESKIDWYSKTREQLTRTGDSWIALFPGSRRNTEEAINAGGQEYIPDPSRPFKVLIVQNRVKTWLTAVDFKCILDLYEENKSSIDADFVIVAQRSIEAQKAITELFKE